ANARPGEGAVVVELYADGRPVALQLTFVNALGQKSAYQPNRRRFNLEPHRAEAVIPIAEREPRTVDIGADVLVVAGLETGLTVARVKQPGWQIIAVPGVGALQHLQVAS